MYRQCHCVWIYICVHVYVCKYVNNVNIVINNNRLTIYNWRRNTAMPLKLAAWLCYVALQSTYSEVCIAEQIGLESSFKRLNWIGSTQSSRECFQHLGPAAEKARTPNWVFIRLARRSHLSVDQVVSKKRMNASIYGSLVNALAQPMVRMGTGSQRRTTRRSGITRSYFLRLHGLVWVT